MIAIELTGTLINYYFHCKRQCWLSANRIDMEDESQEVHIGKALHEIRLDGKKNTEITIEHIKIDRLTDEYLVEIKKSDADMEASKWQVLYYLKKLREKGIERKGKLELIEKNKVQRKTFYYELDDDSEKELEEVEKSILELIQEKTPPNVIEDKKCKKCAYYAYCYL